MINDGGSAFPSKKVIGYGHDGRSGLGSVPIMGDASGMSLRDWFAGMALQAMITHEGVGEQTHAKNCSDCAYYYADAMIKKRSE